MVNALLLTALLWQQPATGATVPETAEPYDLVAIKIETASKHVLVKCRNPQNLWESRPVFEAKESAAPNRVYHLVAKPGEWLIEVTTFDAEAGFAESTHRLVVGDSGPPPAPSALKPIWDFLLSNEAKAVEVGVNKVLGAIKAALEGSDPSPDNPSGDCATLPTDSFNNVSQRCCAWVEDVAADYRGLREDIADLYRDTGIAYANPDELATGVDYALTDASLAKKYLTERRAKILDEDGERAAWKPWFDKVSADAATHQLNSRDAWAAYYLQLSIGLAH